LRFATIAAACTLALSGVCAAPNAIAAPSACSASFIAHFPEVEKAVNAAYDAFNGGDPHKTRALMRKAVASARKAIKGSTGQTKVLLKQLIELRNDPYKVSMMASTMVDLQDVSIRGC